MVNWALHQFGERLGRDDDHQVVAGLESGAAVGHEHALGTLDLDD